MTAVQDADVYLTEGRGGSGDMQELRKYPGGELHGSFRINEDHSKYIHRQTLFVKHRSWNGTRDAEVSVVVTLEDNIVTEVSTG